MASMFDRFTDRARRVLVLAQDEARLLNHNYLGTEHLLLGLISEREGIAAKALEAIGISLGSAEQSVKEIIGVGSTPPSGTPPPFTPRGRKVLELAFKEALQLGHTYIGTEHILLGLIREGEGVGALVLQNLGADLGRVRHTVLQLLSSYGPKETDGPQETQDVPLIMRYLTTQPEATAVEKTLESFGISMEDFLERLRRFLDEEEHQN